MTQLLHTRAVCARYGVSDRTIDRWVEAGELPKPVYIQGRRYWFEESLKERDDARQAKTEAA
jgi:predicted DNA-binding transcriptional regulator AlpA